MEEWCGTHQPCMNGIMWGVGSGVPIFLCVWYDEVLFIDSSFPTKVKYQMVLIVLSLLPPDPFSIYI